MSVTKHRDLDTIVSQLDSLTKWLTETGPRLPDGEFGRPDFRNIDGDGRVRIHLSVRIYDPMEAIAAVERVLGPSESTRRGYPNQWSHYWLLPGIHFSASTWRYGESL